MKKIIVGTTIAAFAMSEKDAWSSWLLNAKEQKDQALSCGYDLRHFAAIQIDTRGTEPFKPLTDAIESLEGEWWTYSLDDGRTKVTMTNRWRHITFGQNVVVDYSQAITDCEYLLFLAADCAAPSNIIPAMLEMKHPLCAPYISTYGLRGPEPWHEPHTDENGVWRTGPIYPFPVEESMASAACIFIARKVFTAIRWRWDMDTQMSDDPCYHHDAKTLLGIPTYVRHDVLAKHYPEAVGGYESRFKKSDLAVSR